MSSHLYLLILLQKYLLLNIEILFNLNTINSLKVYNILFFLKTSKLKKKFGFHSCFST